MDVNESQATNQFYRVPFLEIELLATPQSPPSDPYPADLPKTEANAPTFMRYSIEYTRRAERPRIVKSHFAFDVLPDGLLDTCKVIFVGRNVKDACVSFFYHKRLKPGFTGDFKTFAKIFKDGLTNHGPHTDQVLEAWKLRDHPNLLFLTYEELKMSLEQSVERIARHLDIELSDEKLEKLVNAVHIDSFRDNVSVNKRSEIPPDGKGGTFIRKGIIGDWKTHFDQEMNDEWDPWIEEQLRGTGFDMVFQE